MSDDTSVQAEVQGTIFSYGAMAWTTSVSARSLSTIQKAKGGPVVDTPGVERPLRNKEEGRVI